MIKKLMALGVGGVAFGAALAFGLNDASANTSRSLSGYNTSVQWNDTAVTPAWATLRMELRHNTVDATLYPVGLSTWGLTYSAYLSWACDNGYSQIVFQPSLAVPAGITGNCNPPGWFNGWANSSFGAVDGL